MVHLNSPLSLWVAAKRFAFRRLRVPDRAGEGRSAQHEVFRSARAEPKASLRSALIRPSATFSQREKGEII